MTPRREKLILALYLQTRGFAFVLFKAWDTPIDWAVQDIRGLDKNARCLKRIDVLLGLHTPDVLVLEDMSDRYSRRAPRIQKLNDSIAHDAQRRSIAICLYSRSRVRHFFCQNYGAMTKRQIAEKISKDLPDLSLYMPPERKPWMSEHVRMGIFEATALAWMYFHNRSRDRTAE